MAQFLLYATLLRNPSPRCHSRPTTKPTLAVPRRVTPSKHKLKGVCMKHRIFAHLIVFAATLLLIPTASATWGGFRSMGKTATLGEPSCVQVVAKQVVCLAQSQTHTLMVNEFNNNVWSGWTSLSGAVSSDPSCANDGTGNVVCGVRSGTNTLVATVFNGTTWSSFIDSKGQIFSVPSCALLRKTKVLCAARNLNSALTDSILNTTTSTW